jgi:hypothetical protein
MSCLGHRVIDTMVGMDKDCCSETTKSKYTTIDPYNIHLHLEVTVQPCGKYRTPFPLCDVHEHSIQSKQLHVDSIEVIQNVEILNGVTCIA